ncbi:MAG: DUF1906 domain-containing protein [Bryobacteraceae bacterium]
MPLPGQIEGALSSAPGFDSDTIITAAVAQPFFAAGYRFCVRYLSLGTQAPGDLSAAEALNILNSGLALMPVQHVRNVNWSPSQALGQQDGGHAVANAQSIGFPPGVSVWCDLEGVAAGTPASNVTDHCTAWFTAVNAAGYIPGLYVGANAILTGQQLFDLPFQHYWRSLSRVPDIPVRGYQLLQLSPSITANRIGIDVDIAQTDNQGGQAQWLRIL